MRIPVRLWNDEVSSAYRRFRAQPYWQVNNYSPEDSYIRTTVTEVETEYYDDEPYTYQHKMPYPNPQPVYGGYSSPSAPQPRALSYSYTPSSAIPTPQRLNPPPQYNYNYNTNQSVDRYTVPPPQPLNPTPHYSYYTAQSPSQVRSLSQPSILSSRNQPQSTLIVPSPYHFPAKYKPQSQNSFNNRLSLSNSFQSPQEVYGQIPSQNVFLPSQPQSQNTSFQSNSFGQNHASTAQRLNPITYHTPTPPTKPFTPETLTPSYSQSQFPVYPTPQLLNPAYSSPVSDSLLSTQNNIPRSISPMPAYQTTSSPDINPYYLNKEQLKRARSIISKAGNSVNYSQAESLFGQIYSEMGLRGPSSAALGGLAPVYDSNKDGLLTQKDLRGILSEIAEQGAPNVQQFSRISKVFGW